MNEMCKHGKIGYCQRCYKTEWERNKRGGYKRAVKSEPCKHGRIRFCNACWMAEQRKNDEYRVKEKINAIHNQG